MDNVQPYTFSWNIKETHEGITYPIDTLDRARYASFLTNFLIAEANNGGYVLNINAPWGTGKTYFLNRWLIDLKENHPVVYIDAWKQDFSNDPMLSVVSSIISQLKEFQPIEAKTIGNTAEKFSGFIKDIAPIVAKGVMKKATGIDLNDDGEHDLSKADEAMLGDIAAKVTDKMIKNHNATLNSITTFKNAIQDWIGAIQGNKKLKVPAFIFIDELDRCRPTYAVQMLEVIKHFFEMDNIVFVVATDTEQLQHAIKAVYGQEFDAQTYLGRFFKRRCTLQSVSKDHFIQNYITQKFKLDESTFEQWDTWPKLRDKDDLINLVIQLEIAFNLSLRELEQLIDKVLFITLNSKKEVNLIFLIYLFVLHDVNKEAFYLITSERYSDFNHIISKVKSALNNLNYHKINFTNKFISNNTENVFYSPFISSLIPEIYNSLYLKDADKEQKIIQLGNNYQRSTRGQSQTEEYMVLKTLYEKAENISAYKDWVILATTLDS